MEILQPGDVSTLVCDLIVLLFLTENPFSSYYKSVKLMTMHAVCRLAMDLAKQVSS